MANELNIGVRFSAEGMPQVAKAIDQVNDGFSELRGVANEATKAVHRLKDGLRDPSSGAGTEKLANGFRAVLRPIDELEDELLQLQQAIKRTTDPKQLKAFGDQVDKLNLQISNIKVVTFQNSINKVNQAAAQAAANLKKISPGANEATFALTNLSRIAQDAPFGFIGIANNINPMLESFQRLKAQTGTTKSAFQALIGSLSGAGGLGLAVGIGSAALSLLGMGFFSGGRAAKKAKEEVDEFGAALKDAAGEAARDASRVTTLFNALSSGNLNVAERKKALEELKGINKDFFGSLKDEEGLIKNLQVAYDGYLDRLQDIGRAKAIESQLTKLFDKKLQLELSIDPKFIGATNAGTNQALGKLRKELEALGGALTPDELKQEVNFFDKANESLQRRVQLQQQIQKLEEGIAVVRDAGSGAVRNQIKNLDLQIAGLSQLQKDTVDFDIKTQDSNKKEADALKARLTALEKIKDATKDITALANLQQEIFDLQVKITLRDASKNGLSKEEVDLAIKGFQNQLDAAFKNEALALEGSVKIKATKVEFASFDPGVVESEIAKATGLDKKVPIQTDREVRIKLLGISFVEAEEQAKAAVERLKQTILNGAVDVLAGSAEAFGEALAGAFSGKGIGEAFAKGAQTLLGSIGGVLQEIGKQVIVTSTLIKTLRAALDKIFLPGGASLGIIAGLSLVALGGLLKSIKIPGFAGGVNNFGGGLALVGERGPELVNLPRGSDVIPNHMLGGTQQPIVLQPSLVMDRRGLVVFIQQVIESNSRMGGASL